MAAKSTPSASAPEPTPSAPAIEPAPGPVPASDIPMCWVRDADTADPYLINVADFDPAKHSRLGPPQEA